MTSQSGSGSPTAAMLGNNPNDPPSDHEPLVLDDGDGITALQLNVGPAGVGGSDLFIGNTGAVGKSTTTISTSSSTRFDVFVELANGIGNIAYFTSDMFLFLPFALGVWGTVPSPTQPVLATGAGHTVDDVIALLQSYGFCKQA